jgi:D-glycero-alpha-D-manno-heptose-7-phosphate kinase
MFTVKTTTPTRVDIAGGTLDMMAVHQVLDFKATINIGINLRASVEITSGASTWNIGSKDQGLKVQGEWRDVISSQQLPLASLIIQDLWRPDWEPLRINIEAKSPKGAGIGGSSALAIALYAGVEKMRSLLYGHSVKNEHELVRTVQDLETRLIWAPTGCQDYWGAVRGGLNVIKFFAGETQVQTYTEQLKLLSGHMILCYSGVSRDSAMNNWEIFKKVFDKDLNLIRRLNKIGEIAERMSDEIEQGNLTNLMKLSCEEWQLRKSLWPAIETEETRKIDQLAISEGAMFSRVCGAGGGGVMVVFCEENKDKVVEKLKRAGVKTYHEPVADQGLEVQVTRKS